MPAQHWTLNAAGRWQTEGGRSISFRDNLVAMGLDYETPNASHHRHARLADHPRR